MIPARPPAMRQRALYAGLALALLASIALSLGPTPASAHALLVRSDPAVNARLVDPPARVTAAFTESLDSSLSYLQVLDGEGHRVDAGDVAVTPGNSREMSVGLKTGLPSGFYTVVWQTLSAQDGHLLKGSFPFTLLNPDGSEPAGPRFSGVTGTSGGEPKPYTTAARWLVYLAIVALTGALAFRLLISRADVSAVTDGQFIAIVRLALPGLALAGLFELLAQAQLLGGLDRLDTVVGTNWGERWLQRQGVLAAITVALALARRGGRLQLATVAICAALAGCGGYMLLLSLVSHADSVRGSFWAVTSDFVHLLTTAVWLGMLLPLSLLFLWARRALPPDDRGRVLAAHLQRFSAIAAASLVLLLATGTFNAFAEVSSIEAMVDTSYGRVLTAKLALILPLLAVTGFNALVLRPRLDQDAADERPSRWLSRLIPIEAALGIGVLVIVAVLIYYPTPRQEAAAGEFAAQSTAAVVGFDQTVPAGDLSVNMSVAPNAVGTNSYQVYVFPPAGQELPQILRVRLRFQPPDPKQGPSEIIADQVGPNFYKAVGSFFTGPGGWEVQVDLRREQAEDVTAVFRVPVAGSAGQATGSRYDYPLVAGGWAVVAAAGVLVLGLVLWAGVSQWPGLPRPVYRPLRVGRVASTVLGVGLIIAAVLGFLDVSQQGTTGKNPVPATSGSIALGRELYMANCAVCHGADGRGVGPQAASLPIRPADFSVHIPYHADAFFFEVMTRGLGGVMPAFGDRLTEKQRWDILNWLKSQFGTPAQSTPGATG